MGDRPDPFNVRRCPRGYVCFDPLGPNAHHLTPSDALRLGERLASLAREELARREAGLPVVPGEF
jgi:hypothetical protein